MKATIIIHLLCGLMYAGGAIWSVVGFILYLVKDVSFNWNAVVLLVVGIVGAILNMIVAVSKKHKGLF